jgi:hypothetical protein
MPPGPQANTYQALLQFTQAAAYQFLELLHLHAELLAAAAEAQATAAGAPGAAAPAAAASRAASAAAASASAASALSACWHVLDGVARGSELQVRGGREPGLAGRRMMHLLHSGLSFKPHFHSRRELGRLVY